MDRYCKRLIEVDLPIKKISQHSMKEKNVRKGHTSDLHIWWARRPLASCRAIICAALWPDPADKNCPIKFKEIVKKIMFKWASEHLNLMTAESYKHFVKIGKNYKLLDNDLFLRKSLFYFISDFSDWGNSDREEYIKIATSLTKSAHNSLSTDNSESPLVVDPFAGGGAIPLEALRVGADVFANDINPLAALLNKVLINSIPKYGAKLTQGLNEWGAWVKKKATYELGGLYPGDDDGYTPIAYLWTRTIYCEGPNCGAKIPLLSSLWLAKKNKGSVAIRLVPNTKSKTVAFEVIQNAKKEEVDQGTVRRGSATCPCCGFSTSAKSVRKQLKTRRGGSKDAILFIVVLGHPSKKGRKYRLPNKCDINAFNEAVRLYEKKRQSDPDAFPNEPLPATASGYCAPPTYGAKTFSDLFNCRQLYVANWLSESFDKWCNECIIDYEIKEPLRSCASFVVNRMIDSNSSQCWWVTIHGETVMRSFGRQAYPIIWDFAEINPVGISSRSIDKALEVITNALEKITCLYGKNSGTVDQNSAQNLSLPDDSCHAIITDPPYYDAIPYSDLSDFYIVWLSRIFKTGKKNFFSNNTDYKIDEIVEMSKWDSTRYSFKTKAWYENNMRISLEKARAALMPQGVMVLVFAHKRTDAWEALLSATINAGWIITCSWPISTENARRLRAQKSATLESSIHLVCRPRENTDGSVVRDNIGDWSDVLAELPRRIREWMPYLSEEGIVGADAIFSCIGPALEIFSKYSSVEKASGEKVELREYLEQVWAAVAREALNMIFEGADASGFEEDARLTAMWLWAMRTSLDNGDQYNDENEKKQVVKGYSIKYDAARKIAQGLGAHLESLKHLVEIKGDTATLLAANARVGYLFGKDTEEIPKGRKKKSDKQMLLFEEEIEEIEEKQGGLVRGLSGKPGTTVLDQLHQSMLLFGAGRGEALKRFLVEDGVGNNPMYWRLAQSFSALYPLASEEKRWVDGVLARKKSLGF